MTCHLVASLPGDHVKWMFFDAAWSATNEQRFGAEDPDTKKNADQCKEHYESLKATGEARILLLRCKEGVT